MPRNRFDLVLTQINTKRHWPFAVRRMLKMLRIAEKNGSFVVTLNEISKEQAMAIQALPNWDIFWVINDHLRNGSWSGNAVAWNTTQLTFVKGWGKPTEINYRRGRRKDPVMGPWHTKRIFQACVRLVSFDGFMPPIDIQAFHNPTRFNSDEKSRRACAKDTKRFMRLRVARDQPAVAAGDGNNIFGQVEGAPLVAREGPDGVITNGKLLLERVLHFKRRGLSDHNGLLVKLRFFAPQ